MTANILPVDHNSHLARIFSDSAKKLDLIHIYDSQTDAWECYILELPFWTARSILNSEILTPLWEEMVEWSCGRTASEDYQAENH